VIGNVFVQPLAWQNLVQELPDSLARTWQLWNRDFPFYLQILLVSGAFLALVMHRRIGKFPIALFAVALIVSGLLVLIGRTAPYPRVWLWLLPLYLVTASAGLNWLMTRIRLIRVFIPVTAFLLCAGICINIAMVRSEQPFGDVIVDPDAENVALFLKECIQPGTNYAVVPVSSPLVYYFAEHGIPLNHLGGDLSQVDAERLLVIVPQPDHTLAAMLDLMQQYGLNVEAYSQPALIAQFGTASVWELTR
jgi:hypothetical protein